MPSHPTPRRTPLLLTAAAVLAAAGWTAVGQPAGAAHRTLAPEPPPPAMLCAPAGTLRGEGGQRASVSLCASGGGAGTSLSAPATCGRAGSSVRYTCRTSGTWTLRRDGRTVATGPLPGGRENPGPGTYEVSATVHVRSSPAGPAGVDLRGTVRAGLTLTDPKPVATHRIEADRHTLRPNTTTTVTYTVSRDSDEGDGSARFGLIGEEASGVELTTSDPRCVNPLVGRYPSSTRSMYALDCALTDLQPGRPSTVVVRARLADVCTTVVSKLGYWMPRGQSLYTGGMLAGPTAGCARSSARGH